MDIRVLGAHNSESQATRMVSLLVDDVLALDAGALTSSLSFSAQQKLEAVLLTHPHYDHIRDVPALAFNLFLRGGAIDVYSVPAVHEALAAYFLNGTVYSRLLEMPQGNPAVRFNTVEPGRPEPVGGYVVEAVAVNHRRVAVGYQVSSAGGKRLFYTGDTGPGLEDCWRQVSPQLLIIEVTASNRYEDFAREAEHLTPGLLQHELAAFREARGYLPQVVLVHMNPDLEAEIAAETAGVAEALHHPIALAHEGMLIHL